MGIKLRISYIHDCGCLVIVWLFGTMHLIYQFLQESNMGKRIVECRIYANIYNIGNYEND
jgi:hypothetical protein